MQCLSNGHKRLIGDASHCYHRVDVCASGNHKTASASNVSQHRWWTGYKHRLGVNWNCSIYKEVSASGTMSGQRKYCAGAVRYATSMMTIYEAVTAADRLNFSSARFQLPSNLHFME